MFLEVVGGCGDFVLWMSVYPDFLKYFPEIFLTLKNYFPDFFLPIKFSREFFLVEVNPFSFGDDWCITLSSEKILFAVLSGKYGNS